MSGSDNVSADALSRIWLNAVEQAVNVDDVLATVQATNSDLRHCIEKPGGLSVRYLEFALAKSPIWCDISTGKPSPFVTLRMICCTTGHILVAGQPGNLSLQGSCGLK